MPLQTTGLVVVAAPLPPDFCGSLQEFYAAMVERFQILSPSGIAFFSQGDVLPASDRGLFLLNGTQLFVFDANQGIYVPLDISQSETPDFFVGPADPGPPGPNDPIFWIRTQDNHVVGLYGWTGSEWRASANVDSSGPTSERPGNPADLEHFFDTDINVELRFERGAWRTASNSPGDTKFVTHTTLAEALRFNPGWEFLGLGNEAQRGRLLGQAAKDAGGAPISSFSTSSGITARAAGELAGEETHILLSAEQEPHCHAVGILSAAPLNIQLHRADDGATLAIPAPQPPNNVAFASNGRTSNSGTSGGGGAGDGIITSGQFLKTVQPSLCGTAQPHQNLPQTLFLYCLVKL